MRFSEIGFTPDLNYLERIRINILNIIAILVSIFQAINWFEAILEGGEDYNITLYGVFLPLIILFLNKNHFYKTSKFFLTFLLPFLTFGIWSLCGKGHGVEFIILPALLAPFVMYDKVNIIIVNLIFVVSGPTHQSGEQERLSCAKRFSF